MNSESLGHYFFGQSKADGQNKIVTNSSRQLPTEARCSKGVCEVSWKPDQTRVHSQSENSDLSSALITE